MTRDAEPSLAEDKVIPLRSTEDTLALALAAEVAQQPRETSWRDLVRRLSKNPAKR